MHRHLYARSSRLHSLASLFLVTSITLSIIPSIVFLPVPQVAEAQTAVKAFPSAEGFGANSVGGRGGRAIHVTNLNASGPGSLRACMEATGPRTCIFRVGGTIDMGQNRFWTTNPYLTIAGHTAPGDGIMYKGQLEFNNTHDVIIRYMRARPGENVPNPYTGRSLTFVQGYNLMVDHCSFGWATDDTTGTSHSTATTYQWCIFSEGLNVGTAYGSEPLYGKGGINYGSDPNSSRSYLHNLFANFEDRVPNSSGGNHQIVNNVMYNVRGSSNNNGVYAPVIAEFVNNLYLFEGPALAGRTNGNRIRNIGCGWNAATPCSGTRYDYQLNSNIYVKGNIHTKFRPDNTYPENALVQQGGEGLLTQWTTPHGFPAIPTLTDAFQAKTDVLAKAGVTKPKRDSIDLRAINDVKNKTGVLPGTPADVGGYPTYASAAPYPDADVDGMSDTWESSHGLNPSNQADGAQTSSNGYTHLENFLNELAGDTIPGSPYGGGSTDTTPPSAPGSLTATAVSSTQASLSWNASTDNVGVTGYRVERCTGSTCTNFTQVATPTGTTYNNTGLQANTAYRFRVRAADAAGNLSPYSNITSATTQSSGGSGDTTTGLVSRYTFDNTAQDSAGTNHGTLVGNPMYTTGKLNQALHLDGVDDYANVPHATTLNPGTAFSVAAWFNADTLNTTTSAGDHLVLKGDWNQTNSYSLVFYNNELRCNLGQKWNTGLTYAASNFTPGQWYHAACIADSTGHKLYINGALVASNSQTISSVTTTNPLQIGRLNSNGGHFDGKLDDVRIYNRALAQADVGALYAEGAPPSFDFTLANSGNDTVTQGQSSNNTITATLSAGTAQAVSFSASGLPTGATASFSPTTCSPTCTTTLTITTSPSTPAGFSTITVTGTAGSITKTTNFTLTVNQQDTLSEGLVSRYTFDNTAQDSAGTNHGTLQNGRTYTTGKINQAINLDGVDDYVNLGAPSTFNFGTTQSFTIAAWIKTASPAYRRIWSKGANSWSAGSFLMTTDAGQLLGGVPSGTQAGSAAPLTTGAIVGDGQWHHVAMRVDQSGKMIQTYVDGVARTLAKFAGTCGTASGTALDYALCASANATSASQANIGRNADGNGEYFQGSLDDVRIYNRALTATEVTSLFNFTGSGGSDTTNPTNPANLQATAESSTQVALSWNASTDNIAVTGYILERCEGVSCTTFTQLAAPSGTAHSDSTAAANTSYSYRVKATDAAGNQSGYSNIATLTTPASLKFAQNDRVFVTNTDGSPLNVRSCAGTSCSIVGQQQAGARGTVLTGPTLANNMWWWEIDYDTTPNGWSAEDFLQELAPDTTAPSTPTNITSTGTSGSSIALSWSPATDPTVAGEETSGVASYEVFRNGTSVGTSNTTSFTDTTLSPLTTYTYTITAKDGANNTSAPSASFSQSTESSSVIAPPSATITVTLSTAEGALTRYTTDGSTPIESSTLYSAPFNVTDGTTVKARSFMQGATPSPVVTVLGSASTASGTLAVGSSVRTTAALNVRQIPSTSGTLLGSQAPGATGTITQGPTAADGYTWWFVDYASAPDGWSAGNWLVAN